MGGGVRRLEAAALVDRDVDQHGAALHASQHLARDQLRRAGAGHQHRADDDVGRKHLLLDRLERRKARADAAAEHFVELAQPRQRAVEHRRHRRRGRPPCAPHACRPRRRRSRRSSPAATPGTPPISMPRPAGVLRASALPAASIASRPATSLIGASSGKPPAHRSRSRRRSRCSRMRAGPWSAPDRAPDADR